MTTPFDRLLPALVAAAVLAASGSLSAQEFEGELYGQLRYSYSRVDDGTVSRWASANNASRLGVRGAVAGDDLEAFVHIESAVSIDGDASGRAFAQRFAYGGVRGAWGTVTVGRHTPLYKAPAVRLDPFYDTSTPGVGGGMPESGPFAAATFGLSPLSNGFADRALVYTSPELGGVTLDAGAYVDPDADHDYGLGLSYRDGGLDLGVRYHDAGGEGNWVQAGRVDHALRVYAHYRGSDRWSAGLSAERLVPPSGDSQPYLYAAGTVEPVDGMTVAGSIGHVATGGVQGTAGTGGNLGLFCEPRPGTRLYALVSRLVPDGPDDAGSLSLGIVQGFELGG
ncbi:MAG: porin [Gemmatimonadota bacterium]